MNTSTGEIPGGGLAAAVRRRLPPPPLFLVQPLLERIVRRVARRYPELLERLGPHQRSRFVIDPTNMPFLLYLVPDPRRLVLRACQRGDEPASDARIAARFLDLLKLVDGREDGDAMFFSRELDISGNTEAVVSLRNAIDNVDGSIIDFAADLFGPPGRAMLGLLRRIGELPPASERLPT
ncbi:MAG: SCP2 sterol-binding domain-containing protein [Gammaproteobacteria bacterium]|nr:SCP2 sterol-binding domain-containing protein [Gammaproteobacteria bacterium]